LELKGIYAPIPTPFDESGRIAFDRHQENLDRWSRSPLDGLVVAGSNGELPLLSPEERCALVRSARERCGDRFPLVGGVYAPSTEETIRQCLALADAGADWALLLPPHYFKGPRQGAVWDRHFRTVADASPIPLLLYNMPAHSGVNLPPDVVLPLARHGNIAGIKDSSGDIAQMTALCAGAPASFSVFAGSGNHFLPALAVGARGGTLAVANLYPAACRALAEALEAGRLDEARQLQHRLLPISEGMTRVHGVPGTKALMDAKGLYGGPVRAPLLPASPEALRDLMERCGRAYLDGGETWR
jgi:4-hydroxy-2-oxoglutarate aldolase